MALPEPENPDQEINNPNDENGDFGRPLLRCASQSSFDERSPKRARREIDMPPYKNNNHIYRTFNALNAMRKQNLFCDVILKANDDSEVRAHKMILAACSPYFSTIFTNSEDKEQHVKLEDVDHSILEILIEYLYTAEAYINEENVKILLPAANILQLTDIRDACYDFLSSQLRPSNCLEIQTFANTHGCLELVSRADDYMKQNFSEFIKTAAFLTLSLEQVVKLISSDYLVVPPEEKVFESVISWINADIENRQSHLGELMEHVRFPLLSQNYIFQNVEKNPLVIGNSQCKDFLIEALKYHSLEGEKKILFETPRMKYREPCDLPKVLLVVGGNTRHSCRNVEYYNFDDEKWYELSQLPAARYGVGLSVLGGKVYILGGYDRSGRFRTVDVYNEFNDQWSPCAEMKTDRSGHGVAVFGNCIYAIGGWDGENCFNSAEVYDPWTSNWRTISPMSTKRRNLNLGVVKGFLYAVGGFDSDLYRSLSSVERYNPETDEWESVADMSEERNKVGVGVIDGILYAVGGENGNETTLCLNSVEAYNPDTNQWNSIPNMTFCRSNAGVTTFDGMLYVVGGEDGDNTPLDSIEVYSPITNSWRILPSSMNFGRIHAGVAIINKPRGPLVQMEFSCFDEKNF